ncbi:MAG: 4a-hydroxytetrahydrobiopterin dehydratase [Patescibacteria group bacterium]
MKWENNGQQLTRTFRFADFKQALDFVNKVGELAEAEQHHPDITISYNQVTLSLSTHETNSLTSKDFDLAAKLDKLAE